STDYALGSDLTSAPRFAFQTVLGADAAFSDALTLTTTGTVFDIFPTVTNIDQSPGVHAAVQINFSLIPVAGSGPGQLTLLSQPLLQCGPNVIGPDGQPILCGSSLTGDIRVSVSGTMQVFLTEEIILQNGWTSGFSAPTSGHVDISGTGFVQIVPTGDLTISSASGQLYTGPNEAFPGASVPEPGSILLVAAGLGA